MHRGPHLLLATSLLLAGPAGAAEPWGSYAQLSGSNGFSPFSFNGAADLSGRPAAALDQLWAHPWQRLSPDGPEARDLLHEACFGWRVAGATGWADDPARLLSASYLPGTGIVTAVHDLGELRLTQYAFAPMGAGAPALALLARVENVSGRDLADVSIYSLFDLELGTDRGDGRWVAGEQAKWLSSPGAYVEQGAGRAAAAVYLPLGEVYAHGASPEDPRAVVESGDYFQGTAITGVRDDVVAAYEFRLGDGGRVPAGSTHWVGALIAPSDGGDAEALAAAAADLAADRGPEAILSDEQASWERFQAGIPAVPGASTDLAEVLARQAAFLRMFQVREPGGPYGQVTASGVAAAPVGGGTHVWNITWPRDAAYAIAGMSRACMLDEARDALGFFFDGEASLYQDWVGRPYLISVCRYTGDGTEESDWNADGPNIEYDDFGLFLWALSEYVTRSGDEELLRERWDAVRDGVGDVLLSLVDDHGLVEPDSSIWETHWYGRQAHHTYTSAFAVAGLRRGAELADRVGDGETASRWREGADGIAAAIGAKLVDPATGVLASKLEELPLGPGGYVDAAVVEAFNHDVLDPGGAVAVATLAAFDERLRLASGGYKRNDDGDLYDEHEWVMIDLRIATALRRAGRAGDAQALLDWVVGQARANADIVPELYEPTTFAYAGPAPMMGFGAGALWVTATDALDLDADLPCPVVEEEIPPEEGGDPAGEGCGDCGMAGRSTGPPLGVALLALAAALRRRPRSLPAALAAAGLGLGGCTEEASDCVAPDAPTTTAAAIDPDVPARISLWEDGLPGHDVTVSAASGDRVEAVAGPDGTLDLTPAPGWTGTDTVRVTVARACAATEAEVAVTVREEVARTCGTTLSYTPTTPAGSVAVAGTFNGWDPAATLLSRRSDGSWEVTLDLEPGTYAYKFVLWSGEGGTGSQGWTCDPAASMWQCDRGYSWSEACQVGDGACNSMLRVEDCRVPEVRLESLSGDRQGGRISARLHLLRGAGRGALSPASLAVTLGGEDAIQHVTWTDGGSASGVRLALDRDGLPPGKHTLRARVSDEAGGTSEEFFLPLWSGEPWDWRQAALYYAFVDRFENGDPGNDETYGVSWPADYHGGDWAGVLDRLDYLESLGITALWLSPPQDNPGGSWAGTCAERYTGYHGYWPGDPHAPEDHFGTEEDLADLVDAAHARGIRVLVDYVGNHVHEDHPYYAEHAADGWFTDPWICGEDDGWNQAPETCWFDSFLPDVDYYRTDTLDRFVEDALEWARRYDLDGFRIDAVKHMPHSFHANLRARLKEEVERGGALETGLVDSFYLVGETFTGDAGLIGSYVSDTELTAQFDFPLYYAILQAFARYEIDLAQFEDAAVGLRDYWGFEGPMSNFLGNHDVDRFIAHASGQVANLWGSNLCDDDGYGWPAPGIAPTDPTAYDKLILAWSFLFTWEGIPLVYYGDEIGLPGFHDPDNRQDMRFDAALSADQARVLDAVRRLGQGRKAHPALWKGNRNTWWRGTEVWAYGRVHGDDAALVVLNRAWDGATLTNGLSWAGLPFLGTYRDLLTDETFSPAGDSLTVTLGARQARVLVFEPP